MPLKLYEKEAILDSCFSLFVENGYSKTTTVMLAEAAGISKALLFHHFKSKKKLYISVLERCFEKMALEFEEEPLAKFNEFFEAKGYSGLNKISYLRKNPDISKLLFEAYVATPEELKEEIYEFVIQIKTKYKAIEETKAKVLSDLFNKVLLRDEVSSKEAYELVEIVDDHFRKKIAMELTDESKLHDDQYWEELITTKRRFLDMVRFGIEQKGM